MMQLGACFMCSVKTGLHKMYTKDHSNSYVVLSSNRFSVIGKAY